MRVGVDARSLAGRRGVAHYTSALLAALSAQFPDDRFLCLLSGPGEPSMVRPLAGENIELRRHSLPSRPLFASAALTGRPQLDHLLGGGLDVLWAPALRPLAVSSGVPFVLTVHDLSFLQRPADFTLYERIWHGLARPGRLARRADRVVVDAQATRGEVAAHWKVDPSRVAVVKPGVSRPTREPTTADVNTVRARHGLPERYLLAVGALEPRKAPELLVAAHARARASGLAAELVFAGAGRLAARLRRPGVHVLGHVAQDELEALYAGARAVVTPSWLEGFGLPPLEALARGLPPLVADLSVYDETLGAGALRFIPGDVSDLARRLVEIDSDEALRARLLTAGQAAIATLTWQHSAAALHEVFDQAAGR